MVGYSYHTWNSYLLRSRPTFTAIHSMQLQLFMSAPRYLRLLKVFNVTHIFCIKWQNDFPGYCDTHKTLPHISNKIHLTAWWHDMIIGHGWLTTSREIFQRWSLHSEVLITDEEELIQNCIMTDKGLGYIWCHNIF